MGVTARAPSYFLRCGSSTFARPSASTSPWSSPRPVGLVVARDAISNRHSADLRHHCLQTFWSLPGQNGVAATATAPSASIAR
jgi:hypothetical protein